MVGVGCASPAPPALEIRDLDDGGRTAAWLPLAPDGFFTLAFTHSMYGGSVVETYQVVAEPGGAMRLQRSGVRAETGGAAEYYARYGNFREEAGAWVVEAPTLLLVQLPVRVDRTGDPRIQTAGRSLPLLDLVPDGHAIEIRPAHGVPISEFQVPSPPARDHPELGTRN